MTMPFDPPMLGSKLLNGKIIPKGKVKGEK